MSHFKQWLDFFFFRKSSLLELKADKEANMDRTSSYPPVQIFL